MAKTFFEERKFNIPKLNGISEKTIEEHLKLYSGYVKNINAMLEEKEYNRRFSFEFDGMRNHEVYFAHFEGGPQTLPSESALAKAGLDLERFQTIALTRGIGWAIVYYDPHTKRLLNAWVDEHHLGQLVGLSPILVLDMWEHAYFIDYTPTEKKKYIEAFFENLNWNNVEQNFVKAQQ
ncbi:MAG: Fe-Mn family superoxide dismutase [bacterium]|nr:Fe-Mn family superoxide dismutase [bacterium]